MSRLRIELLLADRRTNFDIDNNKVQQVVSHFLGVCRGFGSGSGVFCLDPEPVVNFFGSGFQISLDSNPDSVSAPGSRRKKISYLLEENFKIMTKDRQKMKSEKISY